MTRIFRLLFVLCGMGCLFPADRAIAEGDGSILTPESVAKPSIHGARVVGVRPGAPFLFTIPVTGERPISFSVEYLPEGLKLDGEQGIITGTMAVKGTYDVTLHATNSQGTAGKPLRIVCGDTIALTPPMGWNSWNCFGRNITDADVRAAADLFVSSGLINHGWTYINIDDGWAGERDADGNIQGNQNFPDMKALCDYVHGKGLKIGIYSSPGVWTCAGFKGSYGRESLDAQRYAEWGFDYLKYDWCSYQKIFDKDPDKKMRYRTPYITMQKALAPVHRDIVYSLCQYGWDHVSEWGQSIGGNTWRTTGDITDQWSGKGQGPNWPVMTIAGLQKGLEKNAGPGHWNDPDMLVVGTVGWGDKPRETRLTPDEQYAHISLWSLLSAPLLIGCDLKKLDPFTLNLLSNDEVIAVDQDALGRQGRCVSTKNGISIWMKDLEDGSKAVGIFNLGEKPANAVLQWNEIGVEGKQAMRDLWRQQDMGLCDGKYSSVIARHGVLLVRLAPAALAASH